MKIKIPILVLLVIGTIFVVFERESLIINGSLILANMKQDISYYTGDPAWVSRYNEAIWLSKNGDFSQAKTLLMPLLNNTVIPKKAEIAELYGDLIYYTSGTLDDTIHMYERSLSFTPSSRVSSKIEYLRGIQQNKTASGNNEKPVVETKKINSGSEERNAKKIELQKISMDREKYLGNTISSEQGIQGELQKLIESTQSGNLYPTQDW